MTDAELVAAIKRMLDTMNAERSGRTEEEDFTHRWTARAAALEELGVEAFAAGAEADGRERDRRMEVVFTVLAAEQRCGCGNDVEAAVKELTVEERTRIESLLS